MRHIITIFLNFDQTLINEWRIFVILFLIWYLFILKVDLSRSPESPIFVIPNRTVPWLNYNFLKYHIWVTSWITICNIAGLIMYTWSLTTQLYFNGIIVFISWFPVIVRNFYKLNFILAHLIPENRPIILTNFFIHNWIY